MRGEKKKSAWQLLVIVIPKTHTHTPVYPLQCGCDDVNWEVETPCPSCHAACREQDNHLDYALAPTSLAHNPLLPGVLRGLPGVRNPFHPSAPLWQSSLLNLPLLDTLPMHPKIKSGQTTTDAVGFISTFIKCSLHCATSLELCPINCFHSNVFNRTSCIRKR